MAPEGLSGLASITMRACVALPRPGWRQDRRAKSRGSGAGTGVAASDQGVARVTRSSRAPRNTTSSSSPANAVVAYIIRVSDPDPRPDAVGTHAAEMRGNRLDQVPTFVPSLRIFVRPGQRRRRGGNRPPLLLAPIGLFVGTQGVASPAAAVPGMAPIGVPIPAIAGRGVRQVGALMVAVPGGLRL